MSLYYPPLDMDSTVAVFRLNLERIKRRFGNRGRKFLVQDIEIGAYIADYWRHYPEARWNGRQIRNACQTALALAEFEAQGGNHKAVIDRGAVVDLQLKHFQRVAGAYLGFMKYMKDVYGTDADQRAQDRFLRAGPNSDKKGMALKTRNFMDTSSASNPIMSHGQTRGNFMPRHEYGGGQPGPQAEFSGRSSIDQSRQQPQTYSVGQQQGFQSGTDSPFFPYGAGATQGLPHRGVYPSQHWHSSGNVENQRPSPQTPGTDASTSAAQFSSPITPGISSMFIGQGQMGAFAPDRHFLGGPGQPFQGPTQPDPPMPYDEARR